MIEAGGRIDGMKDRQRGTRILEINLKEGMPRVQDAVASMEHALESARGHRVAIVKFVHGYGSTGVGGEIRIAVQRRLREMETAGTIRACIFGEDWSASNARTWELLKTRPELKDDAHLGRRNLGITVVVL
jgi:hypothetical protein